MAKVPYIGVDGVARKCKSIYIGVDGVARKVKSGYIGVNGVAKQFYSSVKPVPLSTFAEGDTVYINENGSPVEFYVAKHNYESGLNGSGRTLLVRKNCDVSMKWNDTNKSTYENSTIDTWLNNTYKNTLDAGIVDSIGATSFYYTPGDGNNTVTTIQRSIFLLSTTELGDETTIANTEGTALQTISILLIATKNGTPVSYWTRSPSAKISGLACLVTEEGLTNRQNNVTYSYYVRPAFTLPEDTLVTGPSV